MIPTDRNKNQEFIKSHRNQLTYAHPPGGPAVYHQNNSVLQTQQVSQRILSPEKKAQCNKIKPNSKPQDFWSKNPLTKRPTMPSFTISPVQQFSQIPSPILPVQPSSQLASPILPVQPSSQIPSAPPIQPSIPLNRNSNAPIPFYLDPNAPISFYNPAIQPPPYHPNFPFAPAPHNTPIFTKSNNHSSASSPPRNLHPYAYEPNNHSSASSPPIPSPNRNLHPYAYEPNNHSSASSPPIPSQNRSLHPYASEQKQFLSPRFINQQSPSSLSQSPISPSSNSPNSLSPINIQSAPSTPSLHSVEPPSPPLLPLNKNEIQKEQETKILQPKPLIPEGHREKLTKDQVFIIENVILKRKSYILPDNPIVINTFIERIDKFLKNPSLKVSIHDKVLMGSGSTLPLDILRPFNDVDICYLINKEPNINYLDFFNKLLNMLSTFIQKKVLENNNLFLKLDKITDEILTNKIQIIDDEKGVYLAKYGLFGLDVTVVFYDTQLGQPCLIRDNVNPSFRISLIHNTIYCVDRNQIVNKNCFELNLIHFNQSLVTVNEPEKVEKFAWRIVHAMRKGQEIEEKLYSIAIKQLLKKEFVKSDFEIHKMIVSNHIAHSNDYDIKSNPNHEAKEKSEKEQNQKVSKEEKEKLFLETLKNKLKTFNDHEGELIEFLNFCVFIGKSQDLTERLFGWSKLARGVTAKMPGLAQTLRHYHPALIQIATLIKEKPKLTPSVLHLIQGLLLCSSLDSESQIKCYVNSSKCQPEEIHSYFSYSFETKNGGNKIYYIYNNTAPLQLCVQYFTALKLFETEGIEIEKILMSVFPLLKLPTDFTKIERKIQFIRELLQRKLPLTAQKSHQMTEKKTSKKNSHHQLERKEPFDRLNVVINQHPNDLSITQFLNELNAIDPTLCKHPLFIPLFTSLKLKLLNNLIGDKKNSQPLKQLINAVYHLYAKPNKSEMIFHIGVLHKSIKYIEDQSNIYKNHKHPLEYKEVLYALIMGLSHALSENDPEILKMLINFSQKSYKREYVVSLLRAIFSNVKISKNESLQQGLQELLKFYINQGDEASTFSKEESKLIFNILEFGFNPEIYDSCLKTIECLYIVNANEFLKKTFSDEIVRLSLSSFEGISKKLQPENWNDFNKALKLVIEIERSRKLMLHLQKTASSEQVIKEYSEFKQLRFHKYLNIVIEIFTQFFKINNLKTKGLDHQNFIILLKTLEQLVPFTRWGGKNKFFILNSIITSQNSELIKWGISKIPFFSTDLKFLSIELRVQIFLVRQYSFELVQNYRYQHLSYLKELCRQVKYSDPITVLNLIKFLSLECKEDDFELAMYALKRLSLKTWKEMPPSAKHKALFLITDYFNTLSQNTRNKEIALLCSRFILNSLLKGVCKDFFNTHVPKFFDDLIILFTATQDIEFIDLACWLLVAGEYDHPDNIGNLYLSVFQFYSQIPIQKTRPLESLLQAIKKLWWHFPASKLHYFPLESLNEQSKLSVFNLNHPSIPIIFSNLICNLYASIPTFDDPQQKALLIATADHLFNYYISLDHQFYLKKLEYESGNNKVIINESSLSHSNKEQPAERIENFNLIFTYYAISLSTRFHNGEKFLEALTLYINTLIHEDWQKVNGFIIMYNQIMNIRFDNLDSLLEEFNKLLPYLCSHKVLGWKLFDSVARKLIQKEYDLKKCCEWLKLVEDSNLLNDDVLDVKNYPHYLDLRNSIAEIYLIFFDCSLVNLSDPYFFNTSLNYLQKLCSEFNAQELYGANAIIDKAFVLAYELIVCSFVNKNTEQFDKLILLLKNIYNNFENSNEKQYRTLFNFIIEEIILVPLVFEQCLDFNMTDLDRNYFEYDMSKSSEEESPPTKEHKSHPIFGEAPIGDILNEKPWDPLVITAGHQILASTQQPIISAKFVDYIQVNYLFSKLGTSKFRSKIIEKLEHVKSKIDYQTQIKDQIFVNIVFSILKRIPNPQDRQTVMDQNFRDSLYLKCIKFMNTILLTKPFRNSDPERECIYLMYLKNIFDLLTKKPEVCKGIGRLLALFIAKKEALKKQNAISEVEKKGNDSQILRRVLLHSNISTPGTLAAQGTININAPRALVAQGTLNCDLVNLSGIVNGIMNTAVRNAAGDASKSTEDVIGVSEAKEAKTSRKSGKKNKRKKNKNVA